MTSTQTDKLRQTGLDFGQDNEPQRKPVEGALRAWTPQQWPVARDWQALIQKFLTSTEGQYLAQFVTSRLANGAVIYPAKPFWALELTPLARVSVVILGQDPYHGPDQAQGLAFSVPNHAKAPPSLQNIRKEIERDPLLDLSMSRKQHGASLLAWAHQGVLLLNTVLTVEDGQPASHAGKGWEALTDEIVQAVAQKAQPVVFMLWGKYAQSKIPLIESLQAAQSNSPKHLILTANHPSPLSATRTPNPFIGCGHFSAANRFIRQYGGDAIDWSVGLKK